MGEYAGYIEALEERRRFFISRGATSADHSHLDASRGAAGNAEAQRIYCAAMSGRVTPAEATAFRRHMVLEMARMSCDDGLVMTLHPGVRRNHHPATFARYGADTGHDIPVAVEYTQCPATAAGAVRHPSEPAPGAVHPRLRRLQPGDRATRRVLSVRVRRRAVVVPGQPVGDSLASNESVTEIAGFTRLSGFIDDTRAFCSIPARHDMSRRLDAGFLAGLVAEHRLDEDEALDSVIDLVADQPRKVFKL